MTSKLQKLAKAKENFENPQPIRTEIIERSNLIEVKDKTNSNSKKSTNTNSHNTAGSDDTSDDEVGESIQFVGSMNVTSFDNNPQSKKIKPLSAAEKVAISSKLHYWTDEMDELLRTGHSMYRNQWMKVAAHVGHGKTDRHCAKRWKNHLDPELSVKQGTTPWTEEEDANLMNLYETQQRKNANRASGAYELTANGSDYRSIGLAMGRDTKECKERIKLLEAQSKVNNAPFTVEDDLNITRAVELWGPNARGRWSQLGKEMNRTPKSLLNRWVQLNTDEYGVVNAAGQSASDGAAVDGLTVDHPVSKKAAVGGGTYSGDSEGDDSSFASNKRYADELSFYSGNAKVKKPRVARDFSSDGRMEHSLSRFNWNEEADERLRLAYDEYGSSWIKVAEMVGGGVTNIQCQKRWNRNANPEMQSREKQPWTEADNLQLRQLVEFHRTTGTGKGGGTCINWTTISKEMNRHYKHCVVQWKKILISGMKRGRYTPEEDEIIVARVREWLGRGQGVWAALEKELNRNAASVLTRWNLTLSKKYPLDQHSGGESV